MKKHKPFKVGATYKLRKEYVDKLWFTNPATEHCMEKYGVEHHVFIGECYYINEVGGARLKLDDENLFYAANNERHMFKRIDNK